MSSYYIATGLERVDAHRALKGILSERGHRITYDWTTHGSVKHTNHQRLSEVAATELSGVMAAHFVVVLLPGGFGTHTELGASLAAGKPVFIHSENPDRFQPTDATCVFYHHPLTHTFSCPVDELPRFADFIDERLSATLALEEVR